MAVKKKKVKSKASAKAKVEKKSKVKAKSKVAKVAQPKTKAKKVQAAKKKVVKAKPKKAASKVSKPKFAKPVASRRVSTPARPTIDFHKALQPMQDRILVLPQGQSDRTPGGLYIPAMVSERPSRGEVKAVGKGRRNRKGQIRPLDVKVGDVVLFPQYAGTSITLDGHELLLLREDEVLGIVT